MFLQKKNNAASTITDNPLSAGSSVLNVADGSLFPSSGDFLITLWDKGNYPVNPADDPSMEIVRATARTANAITISGTTSYEHPAGTACEMLITAEMFDEMLDQNVKTTDTPTFDDLNLTGHQLLLALNDTEESSQEANIGIGLDHDLIALSEDYLELRGNFYSFQGNYFADLSSDESLKGGDGGYGGYFGILNAGVNVYLGYDDGEDMWALSALGNSKFNGEVNIGTAQQYWNIKLLDLGVLGSYPILSGYSNGAFGNIGVIADNLIIYDLAEDDNTVLIFSSTKYGLVTGNLTFSSIPGFEYFNLNYPLLVNGLILSDTGFSVGSNMLGSTEFANLVGLNQQLATTSSPQFAGLTITGGGSITPSVDSTAALYIKNATGALTIMRIDTDPTSKVGRIALGKDVAPTHQLEIINERTAAQGGTDRHISLGQYTDVVAAPTINFKRAKGSYASPAAIDTNSLLYSIWSEVFDGANWIGGAFIEWAIATSVSAGNIVADHIWGANPTGASGVSGQIMRLTGGGYLGLLASIAPVSKLHLDSGNATAVYAKFTAGTTTGLTATDGFDIGIDASGNAEIRQRENLPIYFYTNNTLLMSLLTSALEIKSDTYWDGAGSGLPYGEIYGYNVSSTITISGTGIANKVQITAFAANGESNLTTPDHDNDHITIQKTGKYMVTVSITIESAGAGLASDIGISIFKNNGATEFQNLHCHRRLVGGGVDAGSCSISGIASLAANDTIEMWIWNDTNTDDVVVDDVTLSLVQIGG